MGIITLITDFGLKDGNVGVIKGVIWGIAPDVQIVDLSHNISPQNIAEGALVLARVVPYFPPETIHIGVIDPGVGTARRPIAGCIGNQYFVGPDNGLFTLLFERAEQQGQRMEWVHLDKPRFWLPMISHVFHGRDIFAPSGAHIARGATLVELGTPISNLVHLTIPGPVSTRGGLQAEIIHIDHFGNISTSVKREHLKNRSNILIRIAGVEVKGLVNTFGEGQPGELIALFGGTDSLLVCKVNGDAAAALSVRVGDPVSIIFEKHN